MHLEPALAGEHQAAATSGLHAARRETGPGEVMRDIGADVGLGRHSTAVGRACAARGVADGETGAAVAMEKEWQEDAYDAELGRRVAGRRVEGHATGSRFGRRCYLSCALGRRLDAPLTGRPSLVLEDGVDGEWKTAHLEELMFVEAKGYEGEELTCRNLASTIWRMTKVSRAGKVDRPMRQAGAGVYLKMPVSGQIFQFLNARLLMCNYFGVIGEGCNPCLHTLCFPSLAAMFAMVKDLDLASKSHGCVLRETLYGERDMPVEFGDIFSATRGPRSSPQRRHAVKGRLGRDSRG